MPCDRPDANTISRAYAPERFYERIVTVKALLDRWQWKPIRNCPGRFVLVTANKFLSLAALLGKDHDAYTCTSDAAKDTVLVVPLADGGVISYARPDGSVVHTLNTSEGFTRKLSQLGIVLGSPGLARHCIVS